MHVKKKIHPSISPPPPRSSDMKFRPFLFSVCVERYNFNLSVYPSINPPRPVIIIDQKSLESTPRERERGRKNSACGRGFWPDARVRDRAGEIVVRRIEGVCLILGVLVLLALWQAHGFSGLTGLQQPVLTCGTGGEKLLRARVHSLRTTCGRPTS